MKTFFVLLILLINFPGYSQRLVVIGFFDTDDKSIGDGCAVDQNKFRKQYQRLGKALGIPVIKREFAGEDFSESKFDNFDTDLHTTNNDVVLFYVSSHGARSIYDKTDYPQISMNGNYKSVYNKHLKLISAPHKSVLTIIDACNVEKDIEPAEIELFAKIYKPSTDDEISDIERRNAKTLFIERKFDAIVTSSQRGVKSITTGVGGSVFTNCLIYSLKYYLKVGDIKLVSIKNVLDKATRQTEYETERMLINNPKNKLSRDKNELPQKPKWEIKNKGLAIGDAVNDEIENKYEIVYKKKKLSLIEKLAHNNNDYKIILRIKNNNNQITDIKGVKYFFHPETFPEPVVDATDRVRDFQYIIYIWGEFLVKAEIVLDDGTVVDIAKHLKL